ncbi:unnamed protein product [Peniophora sp. CBMAI 1063]|nr:unnamed protein product [Peniophora sp. CBMAI 1063]
MSDQEPSVEAKSSPHQKPEQEHEEEQELEQGSEQDSQGYDHEDEEEIEIPVTRDTLTFNQTVKGILEFIEVAIHCILYVRQIYPADLFIRRKKFDTAVYQSRHPALNEYISGAVKAVGEELILGNVDKVVVVIKDKEEVALERFIFTIQNMIDVEAYNKDTAVVGALEASSLGQYFRSFLVKLNMIEAQLGEMPHGDSRSFAIVLELQDNIAPSVNAAKETPPPWIPAVTQHTTDGAADSAELHMVRAVDTGVINLALAVQESEDKLKRIRAELQPKSPPPSKGKGKERAV